MPDMTPFEARYWPILYPVIGAGFLAVALKVVAGLAAIWTGEVTFR
jgi:hypothetical protein